MEEILFECKTTGDSSYFDMVVGKIEDMFLDKDFTNLTNEFIRQYCHHFEEGEENRLIYTEIFNKYTKQIEAAVESHLHKVIPEYSQDKFLKELKKKQPEELEGEVFDLLLSFSDFTTFKELMLSAKRGKQRPS
eukprot:TRINITY_DN2896_c0_g1_i1.p1 TRINITY_DN2896_c0_g1~~TRINITY_DN2896_c0_g1_i1.p1  ORF type:complete len:134 (-),score=26.03 TRINITY_DN2896_c0_g1_i1:58-459(-)